MCVEQERDLKYAGPIPPQSTTEKKTIDIFFSTNACEWHIHDCVRDLEPESGEHMQE